MMSILVITETGVKLIYLRVLSHFILYKEQIYEPTC